MSQGFINCLPNGVLLHGESFDYQIVKVIGQGSFGITYLAEAKASVGLDSVNTTIYVALKEFFMHEVNGRDNTSVTSSSKEGLYDKYKKKFIGEARNLSKLKHDNIIKVIEAFEANNTVYYSMEFIDGGSLDDLITRRGRLSEEETISYTKQIASALSFMHSRNMLHLDIKPSNIMLRDGSAVLIDFGLSKQFDDDGNPESSTTIGGGTPGYAPLEQANFHGDTSNGLPMTMDIYALGATMFKMFTGHRPPVASDIMNDGFPAHELKERGVADDVIELVGEAMSARHKKRIPDAKMLLERLRKIQNVQEDTIVETKLPDRPKFRNGIIGRCFTLKNILLVLLFVGVLLGALYIKARGFYQELSCTNPGKAIDLGLSVKWADRNVGAASPYDNGDYFRWGDTKPNSLYTNVGCKTNHKKMGSIAGNPSFDAASANWGGSWRTPTEAEIDELINRCQWTYIDKPGQVGYWVVGPNGRGVFFPHTGYKIDDHVFSNGSYYWTATPDSPNKVSDWSKALSIDLDIYRNNKVYKGHRTGLRYFGYPIRPVSE